MKPHTTISLEVEAELTDRDGKVLSRTRRPAQSLLSNWAKMLRAHWAGVEVTLTEPTGGTGVWGTTYLMKNMYAAAGDNSNGMQVGTGNQAVDKDNTQLVSLIAHGNLSGQLSYGAQTVEDISNPQANVSQWRCVRSFTNNYSSTITVKELGLVVANSWTAPGKKAMIERTVLNPAMDVPTTQTLTLRYVFTVTS